MTFKEFKRLLKRANKGGVLISTMQPVLLSKKLVLDIVRSVHVEKDALQESSFEGTIFIAQIPLNDRGEFSVLIGVPQDFKDAEEVTP